MKTEFYRGDGGEDDDVETEEDLSDNWEALAERGIPIRTVQAPG